jgi:hypothetical protein
MRGTAPQRCPSKPRLALDVPHSSVKLDTRTRVQRERAAIDWLRVESLRKRQRHCGQKPIAKGGVHLRVGATSAAFGGLQTCGGTSCPMCGPKVAAQRREDVTRAVQLWREAGNEVVMGTLTLRHHAGQSLDFLLTAVAACWKRATNGRTWARDRRRFSIAHVVRVWEVTWSPENGWHAHVHFLAFQAAGAGSDGLLESMFGRWRDEALDQGLSAPMMRAQELHRVHGHDAAVQLGLYLAKDAELGTAEDVAWEVTGGAGKYGQTYAPGVVLREAVDGDEDAARLWGEYELAMEKRRTIAWTRGMRDAFGLGAEPDPDEVAAAEDAEQVPTLTIGNRSWGQLVRSGLRWALLDVAAGGAGMADLLAWCAARGVQAWEYGGDPPD